MKGLVYLGNRRLELREFPEPQAAINEVVVKIKVAALCGSDLHVYRGDPKYLNLKTIVGHEPSGVIHQVGEGVSGLQVGDRVSVFHHVGCGRCRHCLAGNMMFCPDRTPLGWNHHGADAPFMKVKAHNCLRLPDELSFVDGAMIACQAGTAWSALKKLAVCAADTLVIFGLGPVGLVTFLLARPAGCRIIGVEKDPYRIDLARTIGLEEIVDLNNQDCVQTLKELTGGEGPNKFVETSGSVDAQKDATDAACTHGEIVLVGVSGPYYAPIQTKILPRNIIVKELTITGSYIFNIGDYFELAAYMVRHRVNFDSIITHRFPLEKAEEALKLFDQGGTGKIIFEF